MQQVCVQERACEQVRPLISFSFFSAIRLLGFVGFHQSMLTLDNWEWCFRFCVYPLWLNLPWMDGRTFVPWSICSLFGCNKFWRRRRRTICASKWRTTWSLWIGYKIHRWHIAGNCQGQSQWSPAGRVLSFHQISQFFPSKKLQNRDVLVQCPAGTQFSPPDLNYFPRRNCR